jgi:hypothetical protein
MPKKATKQAKKRGPKPERLVIEGDWEAAVRKALGVERPGAGWPTVPAAKRTTPKKGRRTR